MAFTSMSRLSRACRIMVGDNIPKLKRAQTAHWKRLFTGNFDALYYGGVSANGLMHHEFGLDPAGISAVMRKYGSAKRTRCPYSSMVAAQVVRGHRRHKRKYNALDMDVSTSVYQEALLIEREQRGRKVDALLRTFEDKTGVLVERFPGGHGVACHRGYSFQYNR